MIDLLVANGVVATLDPSRTVYDDGAVAIAGDRIVDVGPSDVLKARHTAKRTIDAKGKAVLPGLIDAHAHAGHGLIKTMGGGNSKLWYDACGQAYTVGSTDAFWFAEAQLAALERLRFGVTTGVSLLGGGDTIMRTDEPSYGAAHCQGVLGVGTRSVVAVGSTRPPHPRTYARWNGNVKTERQVSFEDQFTTCESLIDAWHGAGNGRIGIAIITPTLRPEHLDELPAAEISAAIDQAKKMRDLSRRRGVIFTQDGHTKGSVAFAHSHGLLGPDALLSHSTDLTDEEIAICGQTKTAIAHNPSAIASVYGRCPAPELIEAGATVALGSDGTAPDRSGDMFRHMQQCMHYHRRHFRDAGVLPPGRVLEMCTIDGAKGLGMQDQIGSLEIGKKADLTLVDLRRAHMYPANMPLYRVVCFANGNDVDTVIVDGVVALENRKAMLVDEDAILDAAQRETELLVERLGLQSLLETPAHFWRAVRAPKDS
ncbi:MAG: amidohydrolase family protein [Magnetospirillum sp.]|nr:amidohydrolase family protein [Magnetospirillum sp.]